jgi:hypothetical protein
MARGLEYGARTNYISAAAAETTKVLGLSTLLFTMRRLVIGEV